MLTHGHKGSFMNICRTDPYLVVYLGQIKPRKIPVFPHAKEEVNGRRNWLRVNDGELCLNASSQDKYDYPRPSASLQPPEKSRVNCSFG